MRWYWQLGVIAVLGGTGYAAWSNWPQVRAALPFLPAPAVQAAAPQPGRGGPGGGPQARPVVDVVRVGSGRITEVAEAVGTTRALESVTITSRVTGIVEQIKFDEGQMVERGQELLRLDAAEREADLAAARAAIRTSEAQRSELNQRLERARQLRSTGAGTEAQVADLTLQVRTAETNIVAAQARERAAQARLDDSVVRAPFSGRVGVRQVSIGALVENRTAVTTLDDLSQIRLDFSVPEVLLALLRVGTPVVTRTVAYEGREFSGAVAVVDTRIDPTTRSVRLTALIPNAERLLRPGMFMSVSLEVATRENAIIVPEEAIVGEGPRQVAFVVADGKVDRRVIRTGQRRTGEIEVVEGLAVGEQLVVRGLQRVRQGLEVAAREIELPSRRPPAEPPAAAPPSTPPAPPAAAAPARSGEAVPSAQNEPPPARPRRG